MTEYKNSEEAEILNFSVAQRTHEYKLLDIKLLYRLGHHALLTLLLIAVCITTCNILTSKNEIPDHNEDEDSY